MTLTKPIRILHFADAHIDIANFGRRDPDSGLPQRVVDYLRSLDQIVERAIEERVDLVLFAGDAYKDRNPQPTFQKAWGERLMRLSREGIPTLLLIGNHDIAPAENRAHTLQEFSTLSVPRVFVADDFKLWGPDDLGIPLQVLALPWLTRSRFFARHDMIGKSGQEVQDAILERVYAGLDHILSEEVDSDIPLVLTAHASILGADYGSERLVMLGQDLALRKNLVTDPRFDYVALGHIHKHQCLNEQPPVVYPGSIERIDFGEAREKKGFVLAEVSRGRAEWQFVELNTRPFVDLTIKIEESDGFMDRIVGQLAQVGQVDGAICRVTLEYPHELDPLLDEKRIRDHFTAAFDLRLNRHRTGSPKIRIPVEGVESLGPYELLKTYWRMKDRSESEIAELLDLATEVLKFHPSEASEPSEGRNSKSA